MGWVRYHDSIKIMRERLTLDAASSFVTVSMTDGGLAPRLKSILVYTVSCSTARILLAKVKK